jgi:hypothetical protein
MKGILVAKQPALLLPNGLKIGSENEALVAEPARQLRFFSLQLK